MRPLVLITNDDGIASPHLVALADSLAEIAEVMVVAPERQRSAQSHTITLHKPVRAIEVAPGRYSLSGTPVDCVYVGMIKLAPRPPTIVVSGVNDGYNLGTDVFYSGTVAGAVEGGLRGAVGIALSMAPHAADPTRATRVGRWIVEQALAHPLAAGTVLNVNVPEADAPEVVWTTLGRRHYEDDVSERLDPRGRPYYWIGGGVSGHDDVEGSDCVAIARGQISVTPLHLDLTHRAMVASPPWPLDRSPRW
ncbi:MAG: 5'/3'-nucleotidase SurE [Deltaproteobacteria bacterium]|nr:5'/3'-nucleotidase SurE [Deltaproteobacteria bacterium]